MEINGSFSTKPKKDTASCKPKGSFSTKIEKDTVSCKPQGTFLARPVKDNVLFKPVGGTLLIFFLRVLAFWELVAGGVCAANAPFKADSFYVILCLTSGVVGCLFTLSIAQVLDYLKTIVERP